MKMEMKVDMDRERERLTLARGKATGDRQPRKVKRESAAPQHSVFADRRCGSSTTPRQQKDEKAKWEQV